MAIILNINTAFETAFVTLSSDKEILLETQSNLQKDHSTFLEPAIKKICEASKIKLTEIDAFSVVNGPGSYTGLRVGLSSAKALCYALRKPLILLNSLDVMAHALKLQSPLQEETVLFCPLIDARRQEVYTALYNYNLHLVRPYSSEVISEHFLELERPTGKLVTGGNGSLKLQNVLNDSNIVYVNPLLLSKPAAILSNQSFIAGNFSELAYSEPYYLKPVYFRK
ncbi:MAG: tRNA (adenosine(37)-N6)-threonylcarbamoyltransferase complex dimerization subunit type 1 TsaB [Parafilimonas sp.]|nr:tRNA (adenosine(37)-N6)-threonylcarbamoyltransferase complex dimerization subunit type 1 TsaB [Parafilimonas sp.]